MFISDKAGFSSRDVIHLTGLSYRNLQYWDEKGVFTPSLNRPGGSSRNHKRIRIYSTLDVLVLQAVAKLKRKGMSFQKIRRTVEYLRDQVGIETPFHEALKKGSRLALLTDGVENFYLCRSDREIIDILKTSGQYLLLPIAEIAQDLREKVRDLQRDRRVSAKPPAQHRIPSSGRRRRSAARG